MSQKLVRSLSKQALVVAGALGLAAVAAPRARADQPITSTSRVDGDFSRDLSGGCRYTSSVHGSITPVKSTSAGKAKSAPVVDPKIDVEASVTCPSSEASKITDNVMGTGPLTQEQLEHALERRATVAIQRTKGRCVYVPEFALTNGQLLLTSVSTDCK